MDVFFEERFIFNLLVFEIQAAFSQEENNLLILTNLGLAPCTKRIILT